MEKLTYAEIEDLQRVLQYVRQEHGLRQHEENLYSKLEQMRHESGADLVQAR